MNARGGGGFPINAEFGGLDDLSAESDVWEIAHCVLVINISCPLNAVGSISGCSDVEFIHARDFRHKVNLNLPTLLLDSNSHLLSLDSDQCIHFSLSNKFPSSLSH